MRLHSPARRLLSLAQGVFGRSKAPAPEAERRISGLLGELSITTDSFGVPHIHASTGHDLFYAQGYVTARDRLFQMDCNRLAAAGRLCELFGERKIDWRELTVHLKERTTLDIDVLLRTFGMARGAAASLPLHSNEAQDILAAYAEGVNAFIAEGRLPLEYRILGAEPAPWTAVDSLSLIRAIGFEVNVAWRIILGNALIEQAGIPDDVARVLWATYPPNGPSIVERESWAAIAQELLADREAARAGLGFGGVRGVGSNCFAVAGTHTLSGEALLANDAHLVLQAPQPWHEVRLCGGGYDLRGFAIAGVPGIAAGRTPHHAWGVTAGLVQDLDIFVERVSGRDTQSYLTPEGWRPFSVRDEVYFIRGGRPVRRPMRESRHGPILESLATLPPSDQRFALAWTGLGKGRDFDALIGVWHAKSFADMEVALAHHVCPTYNVTYADAEGHIGYILAGRVPKRRRGTPPRPLCGWTGEWDWEEGEMPRSLAPRAYDPPEGFIVTANNRVAPLEFPYELGDTFEPPYRFKRIRSLLEALGDKVTLEDMASIQLDTFSESALAARDAIIAAAGGKQALNPHGRGLHQGALELWLAWDGFAGVDSGGAAIGYATLWTLARDVVERVAGDSAARAFLELGGFACEPLSRLLLDTTRLRELGLDPAELARDAFERAVELCREVMGCDTKDWRWGRMHTLLVPHRFEDSLLGSFFSIGPVPAPGGLETVNRGDFISSTCRMICGASMRLVVSAKSPDAAATILPGGQSGDRLSPHFDDQLGAFLDGHLKPAPMSAPRGPGVKHEHWVPRE